MGVRLTVKKRGEAGGAVKPQTVLLDDDIINLGRDQHCQVVLAQQAVSRNHARISRDGALFFVEDLGSSYGTTINGQKLPKGEKRLLRNGDTICIAQFDVTFDRVADLGEGEEEAGKTMFVSRKVVKDVMKGLAAGGEQPYFRVMNGPREGQRIEIGDAQEYVFGRDDTADIVLQDDLVSRRHAKVRRDWSGTHVEDLGSRNGIKVNKKKTGRQTLKDRDELEVGGVRLLYIDPTEVRETPVVLPSSTADDDEGTVALKDEGGEEKGADEGNGAPSQDNPAASGETEPSAPGESEAPEEAAPSGEAPAGEEPPAEGGDNPSATSEEGPPSGMEAAPEAPPEDGPRPPLIDLKNKQTLIALGIAGAVALVAIVLIVLLLAGA